MIKYKCKSCGLKFKAIIGTVRSASGLRGYVAKMASIRVQDIITLSTILIQFYCTRQGIDVKNGDRVSVVFKKRLMLTGSYSQKPDLIDNYSAGTTFIV